jgi:acetyl-CoA carboxylase alpha subunit
VTTPPDRQVWEEVAEIAAADPVIAAARALAVRIAALLPDGYRLALRVQPPAEHHHRPVVTLIVTNEGAL